MATRSGIGYDVHRFSAGRKLILGGIEIPHDRGLEGHSDADVLSHAIADALLGAIGAGGNGSRNAGVVVGNRRCQLGRSRREIGSQD